MIRKKKRETLGVLKNLQCCIGEGVRHENWFYMVFQKFVDTFYCK